MTPLSQKLGAKPGTDVAVYFTTSRSVLESRFVSCAIDDRWQALRFVYRVKDR